MTAETIDFWAPLSNHVIRIIRSICSIKDIMEQLHFITTKITNDFSQQYDYAMNNTLKISYFSACQKICRTYINKLKRKNKQNWQKIHHKVYCFKWRTYSFDTSRRSALSKFHSVKRDVNFSTPNLLDVHFLTVGTRYDEFGRKREINYWVNFWWR